MREDILDAAEAIVRDHGIDHLTVRAVAEATHFGKSTIHAQIGSKDALLDALADRMTDRHLARMRTLRGGPEDTPEGRFRQNARLMIEEPDLAAVMFGRDRPDDIVAWSTPWLRSFSHELRDNLDTDDELALAEALHLCHRQYVPLIPTIAESGDADFGGRLLQTTFEPFVALARELEAFGVDALHGASGES